jgi:nickel-dependent lactate racemase
MYLPKKMPTARDPEGMLRDAIREGIKANGLGDKVKSGTTACIVITDRTRPTPNHLIMPILLDTLNPYGIRDADITVIVGVAMHAPDSPEAIRQNVGNAVADRVEIVNGEPDDDNAMVFVGKTSFGTPVEVDHRFAEADIKIGTGNVTPCMLGGWSPLTVAIMFLFIGPQ